MEIKDKLIKPFTGQAKRDFIIKHNTTGYIIQKTEEGLVALGQTVEEQAAEIKQRRINEILTELDKIDLKSIRAIRSNDESYIQKYEEDAVALRAELSALQS